MGTRHIAATALLAGVISLSAAGASAAATSGPTFVDPTATLEKPEAISLGELNYVGPFAHLKAGGKNKRIRIGDESDVQDNTTVDASGGRVVLGDQVILAHGATVKGGVGMSIGKEGSCPGGAERCPSFVSFNAEVDGAVIEKDAMVSALARVAPGIRIPSGRKVLPGKLIDSQDEVATKTAAVTEADRAFMDGVIHVNVELAKGYSELEHDDHGNVEGINYDPDTPFNPGRQLPTFAGLPTRDPAYEDARVIGDVRMAQTKRAFSARSGVRNALRADEGTPFELGAIRDMKDGVTFHALEHTHIATGDRNTFGVHSIVHGGPADYGTHTDTTISGDNVEVKDRAVLFNSRVGDGTVIGARSLVQASDLPAGAVVPDETIIIDGVKFGDVEW
jgi:carbonic anhydrase/acetyltransferase-like protein (isoleucine patch superfamily)